MFLELLGVPDEGATAGLECMCKAMAEGEGSIWSPHPSPFLQTLVEAFTDNGLRVSAAMSEELGHWLAGKFYDPRYAGAPQPAPFPWRAAELPKVYAYLSSKPVAAMMIGPHIPGAPGHSLQTRLLDAFGKFNKNWRRIAVTEAGEAKNQGYIASLPPGSKVRRVEQYAGACSFCRRLDGKIFDVVALDAAD